MNLQSLLKDTVFIEKSDGSRIGPFKTAVSQGSATIFDATLDVNEGEKLIRPLPTGKEETYVIISADFSQCLGSIPPHFTLKLQKTTAIERQISVPKHTTINISNSTGVQVGGLQRNQHSERNHRTHPEDRKYERISSRKIRGQESAFHFSRTSTRHINPRWCRWQPHWNAGKLAPPSSVRHFLTKGSLDLLS